MQLDAINVGGVIENYVDTEHRWSISIKSAILDVAIGYNYKSKITNMQKVL